MGASSQPPFLASLQTLRVIPSGARRVGRQRTDRKQTGAGGENIVRYCTENAAIGAESVTIPPRNVLNSLIYVNWRHEIIRSIENLLNFAPN